MHFTKMPNADSAKALASFPNLKTRELRGHRANVHTVAWNCDGRRLASGSVDKSARIWAPERSADNRSSVELRGHTDSVDQLCWDPTHPDHLATASCDRTVRIWDARSGKCMSSVHTSGANINISWSPDGQHIAVGSKEDVISIIDAKTFKVERTLPFKSEVNEISWNPAGNLFFVTTGQGLVKVLDYPSLTELHTLHAHTANCYCLEFDPRGRYLATGSADAMVSLWELEEYTCVRSFGKLDWPVRTIGFSYDGEFLVSASEDLAIDISMVETGESVHRIECTAAMNTVAWHPSKYFLAYAGDEQEPRPGGGGMVSSGKVKVFGFTTV